MNFQPVEAGDYESNQRSCNIDNDIGLDIDNDDNDIDIDNDNDNDDDDNGDDGESLPPRLFYSDIEPNTGCFGCCSSDQPSPVSR